MVFKHCLTSKKTPTDRQAESKTDRQTDRYPLEHQDVIRVCKQGGKQCHTATGGGGHGYNTWMQGHKDRTTVRLVFRGRPYLKKAYLKEN